MTQEQVAEDLGAVVAVSKTESRWIKIRERAEEEIVNSHIEIDINEKVIELAEEKIAEEKEKFK